MEKSKFSMNFVLLPGDPPVVVMLEADGDSGEEFLACGHCMEPVLSPGDRIRIEPHAGRLRKGDIAVFQNGGRLLAHRVTRVEGDGFWAAGDSANEVEGPIAFCSLRGAVKEVKRSGTRKATEKEHAKAVRVFQSRLKRVVITSPLGQLVKKARNVMTGFVPGGLYRAMRVRSFDEPEIVAAAIISSPGLVGPEQWIAVEKAMAGKRACLLRAYFAQIRLGDMVVAVQGENNDDRPCAVASCFWSRWTVLTIPVKNALVLHAIRQAKLWGAHCIRIEMDGDVAYEKANQEIDI